MNNKAIRKFFPGSNSAYGFYSFYDYIIPDDANRIFLIKGGPGVGKSTFMRFIGEQLLKLNINLEYHCCSADNSSIDGLVIPHLGVALIDGTSPHIVDPKYPGAVDEIIHLGEYWNETEMLKNRNSIIKASREISQLFSRAYSYLSAAKLFVDEVENYYKDNDALDYKGINEISLELIDEIFSLNKIINRTGMWRNKTERHLFATAITPAGTVSNLDTIVMGLKHKYIIEGDDGTGKSEVIGRILDAPRIRNIFVEVYHCALDPHKIDHLVMPELDVAVINSVFPHNLEKCLGDRIVSMDIYTKDPGTESQKERNVARRLHGEALETAVYFIRRAKGVHDELEAYYIPNMYFKEINELRGKILDRIMEMVRFHH